MLRAGWDAAGAAVDGRACQRAACSCTVRGRSSSSMLFSRPRRAQGWSSSGRQQLHGDEIQQLAEQQQGGVGSADAAAQEQHAAMTAGSAELAAAAGWPGVRCNRLFFLEQLMRKQ
jgi:hypothetical protein